LRKYFRDLEETDNLSLIEQILSSNTLAEEWDNIDAILQIQDAIKNKVETLQTQENKLADLQNTSKQKQNTLTSQKQSLTSQQLSLTAKKNAKNELLTETNAQESKYQALLVAAKAQLASFSPLPKTPGEQGF